MRRSAANIFALLFILAVFILPAILPAGAVIAYSRTGVSFRPESREWNRPRIGHSVHFRKSSKQHRLYHTIVP